MKVVEEWGGRHLSTLNLRPSTFFFFFVKLSSLELSDTQVYEPSIRALLGTASHNPKPPLGGGGGGWCGERGVEDTREAGAGS